MTVRPLTPEEYSLAEPIFVSEGGTMPHPSQSRIIGAFDESGSLVGLWTVQLAYHAGPLWVRPDHRGEGLWLQLHEVLCDTFSGAGGTGFYSFSGEPKVEAIFRRLGYTDLGYKVWKKEL
jgi:hypothetical protein